MNVVVGTKRYLSDERWRLRLFDCIARETRRVGAALRGTMVQLGEGNCLLFSRGYVPYLGMYPGMRVPRPIEIVEHHGGAPLRQICHEVLALTKMDWNSAMFASKEPITTAFSEDVGHILAELPVTATVRPQYRFYM